MSKIALLIILNFAYTFKIHAQTQVFKTYENYVSGNGETMDTEFVKWTSSKFGMTVKLKNSEGKVVKFHPDDTWGFTYKGHFFRFVRKELAMLVDTGKVNYFINGSAGLGMVSRDDGKGGTVWSGQTTCFVSVGDANAKIYRMPLDKIELRDYKEFQNDHPDFKELYECFSFKGNITIIYETVRKCIKEFNNN